MIDSSSENIYRLQEMARNMRLDALEMALSTGNGGSHLGGGLSCMEILAVLYGQVMDISPDRMEDPKRDRFLPSKNHCVLAHFPALYQVGFLSHEELFEFQKDGGRMTGYPKRPEIGLEYSGGSLGMALSVGIGIALAAKEKNYGNHIYVLLGDGELNEGSNWEGIMSAAHYKLDNLTIIIDRNHLAYDGNTEDVMALGDLHGKMETFGCQTIDCNGHSIKSLLEAFSGQGKDHKPTVIIADTVKGKGVSFIENKPEWHHKSITQEQYEQAVREIKEEDVTLW